MQKKYKDLFKSLIKSYYDDNFDDTIKNLLNSSDIDKDYLCKIISSLCGVNVPYDDNFLHNLKKAIANYEIKHKIVHKIHNCSMDCSDQNGKTICQQSCPFDAILIDKKTNSTYISVDKCTDCGFCVDACPTGSILDKIEFIPFLDLLNKEENVIAAVAPSIIGQFGENITINQLRSAFKLLGFSDMIEVAFFADMLTIKEAVEFNHLVQNIDDFMITSCCCPMWISMLKKSFKELLPNVSPSVSPMIAAGRVIKKLNPNYKVVFIGPCIAKKSEAKEKDLLGIIDYVLTYEEVKTIFDALKIDPSTLKEDFSTEYASREGRIYGRTGGVSLAITEAIQSMYPEKSSHLKATKGNGIKECKELLNKLKDKSLDSNFIEGMGCIGGCVGGPKAIIPRETGTKILDDFANNSKISVSFNNDTMKKVLHKLNINSISDFSDKNKMKLFSRDF